MARFLLKAWQALLFILLAFDATGVVIAHVDRGLDPQPAVTLSCYAVSTRAAWGAYSQTAGAPAGFRYVPYAALHDIFFGPRANMPNDGIYVLEDMNEDERHEYERVALQGWSWAAEHKDSVAFDSTQFMAVFIEEYCH